MLRAERILLSELNAKVIKLSPDIVVFILMTSNTDFKTYLESNTKESKCRCSVAPLQQPKC